MAIEIEKNISTLIEKQFPGFYREEGEMFIAFVKAYYEWLEQENEVLGLARQLTDLRDIDKTVDEFILLFKEKYLANIQFNIATNKKLFIKNALDFYRAKGTERAVDLFFKLVYGLEAKVYYPGDDLFKLSDNTWINERYLEIIPNPKNLQFVGQTVFGSVTGASAFCERLVRVKKDNQYIEVLYLTGLNGNFQTYENVQTRNLDNNITSRINGSLTSFEILTSRDGFEVGEQVYVSDGSGKKAKAFVTKTTDYVGVVEFTLIEGGWGYSNQAEIIGSQRTFRLDDITFEDTNYFYHTAPESVFGTILQDLAVVDIDNSNTTISDQVYALDIGTPLYAYSNNDPLTNPVPIFEGKIVEVDDVSNIIRINYTEENYIDANGDIILDGSIELFGNTITSFYTGSNSGFGADGIEIPVDGANNATAITDIKAQANVIAWGDTLTIQYTSDAPLIRGDIIYQEESVAKQRYFYGSVANTFTRIIDGTQLNYANIIRTVGFPRTNKLLINTRDELEISILNLSNVEFGAIGINTDLSDDARFVDFANTYGANTRFYSDKNNSFTYTVPAIFQIDTFEEIQSLTDWYSSEVLETELNRTIQTANGEFNFSNSFQYIAENGEGSIDANTTIQDGLYIADQEVSLGSIQAIVTTAQGREYSRDPYFIIYEPQCYHLERYDFYIKYILEEEPKAFRVGENIITLTGNEKSIARIFFHNPTTGEIRARRIRLSSKLEGSAALYTSDDFRIGDTITGELSDVSADIEVIDELRMFERTGLNANILSESFSGTGFATNIQVLDSGFGYFGKRYVNGVLTNGETLNLLSENDSTKTIQAYGYLGQEGISPGTHTNRKSFLSEDKYLQDNNYYQEYSYEILTALPFEKYKQTLIDVLHVAGTRPFGSYQGTSEDSIQINVENSTATYEIKQFPMFVNENVFYQHTIS